MKENAGHNLERTSFNIITISSNGGLLIASTALQASIISANYGSTAITKWSGNFTPLMTLAEISAGSNPSWGTCLQIISQRRHPNAKISTEWS